MKLGNVKYKGPAAYEIIEPETGIRYIGSTENMRDRIYKHITALKYNCHKNKNLTNIFKENNGNLELVIHAKNTKEEAIEYENILLNLFHGSNALMNITKADDKHNEETKNKISFSKGNKYVNN